MGAREDGMRGRLVPRTWRYDPTLYAPARYRRACAYEAFVPDPVAGFDAPLSGETAGVVSDAEAAVHALNARAHPALAPLARLLLRTESIASSRVEGMHVDARALAQAEARVETGGRAGATTLEVLANVDAMELAVEEASARARTTVDDVVRIHAALLDAAPNKRVAGCVRTEQNWVGGNGHNPCGADFVPPPPEEVPGLLDDLGAAMGDEHLPPLVQAALVHAQFETIHPFLDGNGRTGRALVHVVLRRRGLAPAYMPPVSVVLAADRAAYVAGLTRFRAGDVDGWVTDFAVATARAAGLAGEYLTAVGRLQEEWRASLAATVRPRADAAAWRVIDVLPAHPVVSVPVAVAATGRSKAVVNHAMGQLEEAGVLTRLSTGARNRTWEAVGLLGLLAALEDGLPAGG
jgi:Fic family protein